MSNLWCLTVLVPGAVKSDSFFQIFPSLIFRLITIFYSDFSFSDFSSRIYLLRFFFSNFLSLIPPKSSLILLHWLFSDEAVSDQHFRQPKIRKSYISLHLNLAFIINELSARKELVVLVSNTWLKLTHIFVLKTQLFMPILITFMPILITFMPILITFIILQVL